MRKLWILPALLIIVALAAAACGGGDDGDTDSESTPQGGVRTPIEARFLPIVISSDLAVGESRFLAGLIDQENDDEQVAGAVLTFGFSPSSESEPRFTIDADAITLTRSYTHTHDDGTVETHEAGETGAYVAYPDFDEAGEWAVRVSGTVDGAEIEPVRSTFSVNQESFGLAVGDPAPASEQPTLADVADIGDIDTSETPIEAMHTMTIAEAVSSGKPTLVAFATPAFCVSQICGPIKDIVDDLYGRYGDEVNFVHVEPYAVPRMRDGECASLSECLVPAVEEWGLQSEPWVFIVDAEGNIAAKFDTISSYEEMESALQATLG